ncbi:ATP-binding cassette domain-containing protein [Streptomyces sp. FXJ1.4098]|nr:ATP-binding cassette domain-containing protein [Streptomyces sp. FXJ1.4098]
MEGGRRSRGCSGWRWDRRPRLGDNGAGKSTLIKILSGFHKPTTGTIVFVGSEPTKGFGPFRLFDKKLAGEIAVREMQSLGITRVTDGNRLVGSLSGGERQALAIARAVYFGANVLILDEPTAALGVKEAAHVLRIVMQARAKGGAVILVTHDVRHAMMVGDHFAVLIRGQKADDLYKGERTREEITDLMAGGEAMAHLEVELAQLPADA